MIVSAPLHVLGIAGSLREASYNRALLRAAAELMPEGMTMESFDLASIPLYNEDVERAGAPEPVQALKAKIRAADALVIATPEYNYSIPGVLKNAIDWVSRPPNESPFNDKPLAIMGAGGRFGTARAQYQLRQMCVFLNLHPLNKPEVMVIAAWEKFDAEGRLIDEPTRALVATQLAALAEWTRRLRSE